MQNGHPISDSNQEFSFTPESGYVTGNPDVDNSLNADAYSTDRDPRGVGGAAIYSADTAPSHSESKENTSELIPKPEDIASKPEFTPASAVDLNQGPKLAEIIDLTSYRDKQAQNDTEELETNDIKIDKVLSDAAVRKIDDKLIRKLGSDKDTNYFYRNARKTTLATVENSYEESAIWKGEAA